MEALQCCYIQWSTQSGRSKACARRTSRILREQTTIDIANQPGSALDDGPEPFLEWVPKLQEHHKDGSSFLLLFVSTTGDGEHCDSIRDTWNTLLSKSLPNTTLQGTRFAMFCLGDRAYGPQFCAAGRKLAVRLMQLGMSRICEVGYGDDNTPNGGVFCDLDEWMVQHLLPTLEHLRRPRATGLEQVPLDEEEKQSSTSPYSIQVGPELSTNDSSTKQEWENDRFRSAYQDFFETSCSPRRSYNYHSTEISNLPQHYESQPNQPHRIVPQLSQTSIPPLLGRLEENTRITATDWNQETRHIRIAVDNSRRNDTNGVVNINHCQSDSNTMSALPYHAGDIASVLPSNSEKEVKMFLSVLPSHIQRLAHNELEISIDPSLMNSSFVRWPSRCTLYGWLTFCADIHSLPEREDLRALSAYCSDSDSIGISQREKLRSLSETSETALYADYILKEKRSWADVLFDFKSLRSETSKLSIEALLVLIPAIRPRDFSIASAPTLAVTKSFTSQKEDRGGPVSNGFFIEICVAVVAGKTRLGRTYHGLCSKFLSRLVPTDSIHVWIRPGSFRSLPLELSDSGLDFKVPILCVGAGTGIAPMRSLLLERQSLLLSYNSSPDESKMPERTDKDTDNNVLVFGCRKEKADFYYQGEWSHMVENQSLRLLTAFSQDQPHKMYVQKVLREADSGAFIVNHILGRKGAVYVAGGPKMARAVKQEIVEALTQTMDSEKSVQKLLNQLQRQGLFAIEAWS